jgi:hypothetical protein
MTEERLARARSFATCDLGGMLGGLGDLIGGDK